MKVHVVGRPMYLIGDERDSFFQVDSESLSITFDRHGVFESADMLQG